MGARIKLSTLTMLFFARYVRKVVCAIPYKKCTQAYYHNHWHIINSVMPGEISGGNHEEKRNCICFDTSLSDGVSGQFLDENKLRDGSAIFHAKTMCCPI